MDLFIRLFLGFVLFILVMTLFTRVQQRSTVYVAVVAEDNDPNAPRVIGVYYQKEKAQAKVYQYGRDTNSIVYSDVVKCEINQKQG